MSRSEQPNFKFAEGASWSLVEDGCNIFATCVSPDFQYVGSCLSNGLVTLRSLATGRLSYTLVQSSSKYASTSLRFHPKDNRFLYTVSADGFIKEWNIKSPTDPSWQSQERDNQIFSIEISPAGEKLFTGGKDCKIRVYDTKTKEIITELSRNEFDLETTHGHCNRIFSILCPKDDPFVLYSGGWDNTIQVWDLRTSSSVRAIFGPYICGDSLDYKQNTLLAGCWKSESQFTLWDIRTFSQIRAFSWNVGTDEPQCRIYTSKFSSDGRYIIGGGSGVNELKAFSSTTYNSVGTPLSLTGPAFSFCWAQNGDGIVVGTKTGLLEYRNITIL